MNLTLPMQMLLSRRKDEEGLTVPLRVSSAKELFEPPPRSIEAAYAELAELRSRIVEMEREKERAENDLRGDAKWGGLHTMRAVAFVNGCDIELGRK